MFKQPRIPGLNVPKDNIIDKSSFQCVGFDLTVYTVPGSHKYGNCRSVNEYQKISTIAEGTYGNVYMGQDLLTHKIYAVKKLKVPKEDREDPQTFPRHFLRYVNNLKRVKHLNLVNLKEVVVGKNFENNYLVLDYCKYSLAEVLANVEIVFFQHPQIKNIMLQMLNGLQHIHRFNIVHRDLCPKNILFTETGILKISDFGSSRVISSGCMTPGRGLKWYRAPEHTFGSTKYTKASDIWSVGCMFAEMVRKKPLFRGKIDGDVVRQMIHILGSPTERNWPGYSKLPVPRLFRLRKQPYNRVRAMFRNQTLATVKYLEKFLKWNPAARPSVEEVMEDQYYIEYPHRCADDFLVRTLKTSKIKLR